MDKKKVMNLNPTIYKIIEVKSAIDSKDFQKAKEIIADIKEKQELSEHSEFLERVIAKLDELIKEN